MTTPNIPNVHLEKDSLGVGQAVSSVVNGVTKLFETLTSAIGTVYEPTRVRRLADTKAYEQRVLADAKAYEIKTLALAKSEAEAQNNSALALTIESASKRFVAQEVKRQLNIDNIVAKAVEQIQREKKVSDKPVDPDWTTRFINIAKDVSDNEMQDIWAQILAGEVASPGKYSYRTLECLKNLTKEEAELFVRVSSFVLKFDILPCIYRNNEMLKSRGVEYMDLQKLVEIGLLNATENICIVNLREQQPITVANLKKKGICKVKANGKKLEIPIYTFTSAGLELLNFTEICSDDSFLEEVLNEIQIFFEPIEYAYVTENDGGSSLFDK